MGVKRPGTVPNGTHSPPKVPASPPSHEINSPANLTFPCHPDRAPGWRELSRLIYCAHPGHTRWAERRLGPPFFQLMPPALHVTAGPGFRREGLQGTLLSLIPARLGRGRTTLVRSRGPGPSVFPRRVRWTAGRGGKGGHEHEQLLSVPARLPSSSLGPTWAGRVNAFAACPSPRVTPRRDAGSDSGIEVPG